MQITKTSKLFTIGSCFAYEVQHYLTANGYSVLNQAIEHNPADPELIWYNTYTIAYEFDRVAGSFKQGKDDIWQTPRGWQDPYRRLVFAPTVDDLRGKITAMDASIRDCINAADVFIITLGLTEVFFMANGRAICAIPSYGGGGGEGCQFKATEFEENLDNMNRILAVIGSRPLILTVSPVPLVRTFTNAPAHVANCESKSVLRAVAGRLTRTCGNVHYLPSYEMALADPQAVYKEDHRHVTPTFVARVMAAFEQMFVHS